MEMLPRGGPYLNDISRISIGSSPILQARPLPILAVCMRQKLQRSPSNSEMSRSECAVIAPKLTENDYRRRKRISSKKKKKRDVRMLHLRCSNNASEERIRFDRCRVYVKCKIAFAVAEIKKRD